MQHQSAARALVVTEHLIDRTRVAFCTRAYFPKHAQIFLSALAFEEDVQFAEEANIGGIWIDGIVKVVTDAVNERASQRRLDMIGPHREDVICFELQGAGFAWSVLDDRSMARDLVKTHVDEMIDPDADLSPLAEEIVEAFLRTAGEDEDGNVLTRLVQHFGAKLRSMIMEQDVLPSLQDMRGELLASLDRGRP